MGRVHTLNKTSAGKQSFPRLARLVDTLAQREPDRWRNKTLNQNGRFFFCTAEGLAVPPGRGKRTKNGFFFEDCKMDSTAIAAIDACTASVNALTGTLWVFAGVLLAVTCGYLAVRYTLRG